MSLPAKQRHFCLPLLHPVPPAVLPMWLSISLPCAALRTHRINRPALHLLSLFPAAHFFCRPARLHPAGGCALAHRCVWRRAAAGTVGRGLRPHCAACGARRRGGECAASCFNLCHLPSAHLVQCRWEQCIPMDAACAHSWWPGGCSEHLGFAALGI